MLLVDSRAGSHELIAPLQQLGLEAEETTLEYGDVTFEGQGEGGKPVHIGLEFKQLRECVASLRTGRLQGHQLPGMQQTYDYSWLLIEGELLFNAKGQLLCASHRRGTRELQRMPGTMGVSEFLKRILVLHLRGGLNPWFTRTRKETLKFIEVLYRTWTDQALDEHKSHLAIYTPPRLVPISPFREAVCKWPRIGLRTSKVVEECFGGSLRRAARASVDEWAALTTTDDKGRTKRLGQKAAQEIDRFLEGKR